MTCRVSFVACCFELENVVSESSQLWDGHASWAWWGRDERWPAGATRVVVEVLCAVHLPFSLPHGMLSLPPFLLGADDEKKNLPHILHQMMVNKTNLNAICSQAGLHKPVVSNAYMCGKLLSGAAVLTAFAMPHRIPPGLLLVPLFCSSHLEMQLL